MGRLNLKAIEGENIYACYKCGTHLTNLRHLISK